MTVTQQLPQHNLFNVTDSKKLTFCSLGSLFIICFSAIMTSASPKNTSEKWIDLDFEMGNKSKPRPKSTRTNIPNNLAKKGPRSLTELDFERSLEPQTVSELAVHPKKVQEVESWLDWNIVKNPKRTATFLIITGPSGCGKTATVRVLCRKMSISIREWTNPVEEQYEYGKTLNQVEKFKEFMIESRYQSLFTQSTKCIVLVEDFPNVFIRNPAEFSSVLEYCHFRCNHPVIFICNESFDQGSNIPHALFPQEIRDRFRMSSISFNACAMTIMKIALNRALKLAQENRDSYQIPNSNAIEEIIATSMGDIRSVMNQFYFASLLGSSDLTVNRTLPPIKTRGRKRKQEKGVQRIARDEHLGLFHGLGRVLNPKKVQTEKGMKLNCDLDKLIDEFSIQPTRFVAFLFENYLKYFGDIEDVCKASEYLSLGQTFLDQWIDRNDVFVYALWVSVMGLMLCNEHRVSKWNQICGPKKIPQKVFDGAHRNMSPTDLYYQKIINKSPSNCFFVCS